MAGGDPAGPAEPGTRLRAARWSLAGTAAALILSPVLELLTGREALYPAVTLALVVLFWAASGTGPRAAGFTRGSGYGPAILHPLLAVTVVAALALVVGATRVADLSPARLSIQIGTMAAVTTVGTLLTEDGFFRGWLWGTLERAGRDDEEVLLWTAGAAALWHLPLVLIEPALRMPPEQVTVHIVNLWLLGLCWGLLRLASGSVVVVAVSHGVWAGLAYPLFGFATGAGALGVSDSLRYDPERGWAGVAVNAAAFLVLRRWWRASPQAADGGASDE